MTNALASDLDQVLEQTEPLWNELRGERLFITGGTGFVGCWLLESFAWAHDRLNLGAELVALTRNPAAFAARMPHLASHPAVELRRGDVKSFTFPADRFSHIIHAATESNTRASAPSPTTVLGTIVDGTRHVLEFAAQCGASTLLFTSSGAVYGRQPADLSHVDEEYRGAPDPLQPAAAYGEGKRCAELLCAMAGQELGLQVKMARCFAFVGPYLPLDIHFAVGNFIRDGLHGGPIVVNGDGTPLRSYMYAGDLVVWLLTIMLRGDSGVAFNVGSESPISIAELAGMVAARFSPPTTVRIAKRPTPGALPERYVPRTSKGERELGLTLTVSLDEALDRTIAWHRSGAAARHVNN